MIDTVLPHPPLVTWKALVGKVGAIRLVGEVEQEVASLPMPLVSNTGSWMREVSSGYRPRP